MYDPDLKDAVQCISVEHAYTRVRNGKIIAGRHFIRINSASIDADPLRLHNIFDWEKLQAIINKNILLIKLQKGCKILGVELENGEVGLYYERLPTESEQRVMDSLSKKAKATAESRLAKKEAKERAELQRLQEKYGKAE